MTRSPSHPSLFHPTGLGTSAAHITVARPARKEVTADADDSGPRFRVPWPARLNPEVEQMRRRSLQWAESFGMVNSAEEVRLLDEPRFDLLAGYANPDARGLGAQLVSDWMFWYFPFDDWFDGPLGDDPAAVRAVVEPMIRFAYGDSGALPLLSPPLVRAFADLCGRTRMGMSPTWQSRFAQDMSKYLFSYSLEAAMRRGLTEQNPPNLDHVIEIRRDAIAIRPSMAYGESAEGRELAFPLALSETFHQIRKVCADTVVVQNDAYSLGKDLHQGEVSNQAVVLMSRDGMTAKEAIRELERTHDRLITQYLDLEAIARTLPRDYGLPEQTPIVAGYLSNSRCWTSGNNAWSRNTKRYTVHHQTTSVAA
ncbi:hypothetical protein AB0I81_35150 [Nonomuraea sp. NPDC050404]|uniref:terpene synthase family protein n=1 Tax=Nonomuraea sp. NPDC050404 TaxID=3155783 RepID=UPI00340E6173